MLDADRQAPPVHEPSAPSAAERIVFHLPGRYKRRSGRKEIVFQTAHQADMATRAAAQRPFVVAIARAWRWLELLEEGRFDSVAELAEALGADPSFVRRTLSLTLINPDLINQIFAGMEREGVSLEVLIRGISIVWTEQPK
jgi:hypothetical protein